MKKLLVLLFSLLISFNSYGSWFGLTSIEDTTCTDFQEEAKGAKLKNLFGGEFKVLKVSNSREISRTKDKLVCIGDLKLDNGVSNSKLRMELTNEDGEFWFKYIQDDNPTLKNEKQYIKPIISRSKFADEVSNCKEITNNENRLYCYDNLNTEYAVMIPSIDKIFKDGLLEIGGPDRPFYGCIYSLLYEEDTLYTDKRRLWSIGIGNQQKNVWLIISDFADMYMGDEDVPKIGDCFAFNSEYPIKRLLDTFDGYAEIYDGEYNINEEIDETADKTVLKNKITVDEYFEQGVLYTKKLIELTGEVGYTDYIPSMWFTIVLFSENGSTIEANYYENYWKGNDLIENKIRSIDSGDIVTFKGYFEMGDLLFVVTKILD